MKRIILPLVFAAITGFGQQIAAQPYYLDVSPNNQDVYGFADTKTFHVDANVGWNVTDDADWLTATKTDGSTITVTYGDNHSSGERIAHITATGTGGVTETVTITQMIYPFLIIDPEIRNVSAASGSTTYSVSSNMDWGITNYTAAWLVALKTDANTITVTYDENTSTIERGARITVVATVAVVDLTLTQAGNTPYLDITPDNWTVNALAGSITYVVTANVGWSVTDDADWLTAVKTDGSTITVTYEGSNTSEVRTASITATGTGGVSETVTLTQTPFPYIMISPAERNVGPAPGSTTFIVHTNTEGTWNVTDDATWLTAAKSNDSTVNVTYDENSTDFSRTASITVSETAFGVFGTVTVTQSKTAPYLDVSPNSSIVSSSGSFTTFSVSANVEWTVTDDADWLIAEKTDGTTITAAYEENTSDSDRTANITATGTGGVTETVTVTQKNSFLAVDPENRNVSSASGSTTFSVTTGYEWSVSDSAEWLTATKIDAGTIGVSYEANPSGDPRKAYIDVISYEAGATRTVTVTQAGTSPYYLDVTPDHLVVAGEAGTTTLSVSSNVEWSVANDTDWLTATKTDAVTILVSYEANASNEARTASFTVAGTGGISDVVTIIQEGGYIYIHVDPDSISVSAEPGSASFTVSTNVEGTDWDIEVGASWLTATRTGDSAISISYEANPWIIPRTAPITAYVIYTEVGETVKVTQEGAAAYLEVSPDNIGVSFEEGSATFTVLSNIDWWMSEVAEWLSAIRSNDTLVTVTYEENPHGENRYAVITLHGEGVSATEVYFEQGGYFTDGTIDLSGMNQVTICPNPSPGKIYLSTGFDTGPETLITLYDVSGKIICTINSDRIQSRGMIEIDLSPFHPGIYILQVKHPEFTITEKIIRR